MFGMGWSELILIGVIALIVVGPKDLPNMFRAMGQFTGKARSMAREFSRAMEAAADDAGVKDVQKTLRAAANPSSFGTNALKQTARNAVKPPDHGLKKKDDGAPDKAQAARDAEIAEMEAEAMADEADAMADEIEAPAAQPAPARPAPDATADAAPANKPKDE